MTTADMPDLSKLTPPELDDPGNLVFCASTTSLIVELQNVSHSFSISYVV